MSQPSWRQHPSCQHRFFRYSLYRSQRDIVRKLKLIFLPSRFSSMWPMAEGCQRSEPASKQSNKDEARSQKKKKAEKLARNLLPFNGWDLCEFVHDFKWVFGAIRRVSLSVPVPLLCVYYASDEGTESDQVYRPRDAKEDDNDEYLLCI